jgi:hypothetical protein
MSYVSRASLLLAATKANPIPQLLKGIIKFHDIKASAPLLAYLSEQIGESKFPKHSESI